MLLNSKSILDCEEFEENTHNKEIEDICEKLTKLPDYRCVATIKYVDPANSNKKEKIVQTNLHDILEMIEYVDFKNGVDLEIGIDNLLTFVAYGEFYIMNGKDYFRKTCIHIMPYVGNYEFVDISSFLVDPMKLFFDNLKIPN